jgi:hypothetical protein
MKTKQILLGLLLLFSLSTFSQTIGFHFGITSSNMYDRDQFSIQDENYESVLGIDIGVDLKINLKKNFAILSGISFYQNGFHEDALMTENTGTIEKNIKLNYLKVPVNILLQTNGKTKFGIRGGTYFSYLIGGDFEEIDWYTEVELEDAYTNFDWGLTFGGVLSFNQFTLDLGYDLGIRNISTQEQLLISDNSKNRSWSLKLIYFLK